MGKLGSLTAAVVAAPLLLTQCAPACVPTSLPETAHTSTAPRPTASSPSLDLSSTRVLLAAEAPVCETGGAMIPLTVTWRWRLGGTAAKVRPLADTWPAWHDIWAWEFDPATSHRFEMPFSMPSEGVAGQTVTLSAEVAQHIGYEGDFVTADAAQQPITAVLPDCP
jgi:hypothetical protein